MKSAFSFQFTTEAKLEYSDAYIWYEEQLEGLGERFAEAVRKKLHLISLNPTLYSSKKMKYYETILGSPFPFVIV